MYNLVVYLKSHLMFLNKIPGFILSQLLVKFKCNFFTLHIMKIYNILYIIYNVLGEFLIY
jgi:hypothetical protein